MGGMAPCKASFYARLLSIMNYYYPHRILDLIWVKNVNGNYVCYDKDDETIPLCDGCETEVEALEITLMNLSVRQLICHKYMNELNQMMVREEPNEMNDVMKNNEGSISLQDEMINRYCVTRHHLNSIILLCELFNYGLFRTEFVLKLSFDYLITPPNNADDDKTEVLCKVLNSVGRIMCNDVEYSNLFESIMCRIEGLKNSPTLTSRVRFGVMDLIDLSRGMDSNVNEEYVMDMGIEDKNESEEESKGIEKRMKRRIRKIEKRRDEKYRKERLEAERKRLEEESKLKRIEEEKERRLEEKKRVEEEENKQKRMTERQKRLEEKKRIEEEEENKQKRVEEEKVLLEEAEKQRLERNRIIVARENSFEYKKRLDEARKSFNEGNREVEITIQKIVKQQRKKEEGRRSTKEI